MTFSHVPVLLEEVMELLAPERGGIFVDGTLGGGGHAEATLTRMPQSGRLIGIDRDWDAVAAATERLRPFGERFQALHGNFFDLPALLASLDIGGVDGILFDFGVSSHQLDTAERGFSYHADAPLDMRMDRTAPLSARDVVNGYSFEQLCRILREYGEERFASRIADRILREREKHPIETTAELSAIVCAAMPGKSRHEQQHPARRTFQAIRIEVNGELKGLDTAVRTYVGLLNPKGRMCVITFHSEEDRIVKQTMKDLATGCICDKSLPVCVCGRHEIVKFISNKAILPSKDEQDENGRSKSAKLRVIEKL